MEIMLGRNEIIGIYEGINTIMEKVRCSIARICITD